MTTPEEVEEAVKVAMEWMPSSDYAKQRAILSKLEPFLKAQFAVYEAEEKWGLEDMRCAEAFDRASQEYRALMAPPEVKEP